MSDKLARHSGGSCTQVSGLRAHVKVCTKDGTRISSYRGPSVEKALREENTLGTTPPPDARHTAGTSLFFVARLRGCTAQSLMWPRIPAPHAISQSTVHLVSEQMHERQGVALANCWTSSTPHFNEERAHRRPMQDHRSPSLQTKMHLGQWPCQDERLDNTTVHAPVISTLSRDELSNASAHIAEAARYRFLVESPP